jgi:hypothetical protein
MAMNKFREIGEQMKNLLFGKSEVKNRISSNAVKMILGDVTTLYAESLTRRTPKPVNT